MAGSCSDTWGARKWGTTSTGGGPGSDTTAIHVDVAGEIAGIAVKALPVGADLIVIEDSADGNAKKSVAISTLPTSATLYSADGTLASNRVVETSGLLLTLRDTTNNHKFQVGGEFTHSERFACVGNNAASSSFAAYRYSNSSFGPKMITAHARGTEGVPVALSSGDMLGRFVGLGFDGTGFPDGTEMRGVTTEAWTGIARGCEYQFYTIPNGALSQELRLTIGQDGDIVVGDTGAPGIVRGTNSASGNGEALTLKGGDGGGAAGAGGKALLQGGTDAGTGAPGDAEVLGGTSTVSGDPGDALLTGGSGTSDGGAARVRGADGAGASSAGGTASSQAGNATGGVTGGTNVHTAGNGGATGAGGPWRGTAGDGGSTSGAGGSWTGQAGNANPATGDGAGGLASINGGDARGAHSGGNANQNAGFGGTGATGNGGSCFTNARNSQSTNGDGGSITEALGAATGSGIDGVWRVTQDPLSNISRSVHENTGTASIANAVHHSAFGNVTVGGLVEQTRVESGWLDIGELTNNSDLGFYARVANVLREKLNLGLDTMSWTPNLGSSAADMFIDIRDGAGTRLRMGQRLTALPAAQLAAEIFTDTQGNLTYAARSTANTSSGHVWATRNGDASSSPTRWRVSTNGQAVLGQSQAPGNFNQLRVRESRAVYTVDSVAAGATFTTSANHGLSPGDTVVHAGFADGAYNGTFVVDSTATATTYVITSITFTATGTGTSTSQPDNLLLLEDFAGAAIGTIALGAASLQLNSSSNVDFHIINGIGNGRSVFQGAGATNFLDIIGTAAASTANTAQYRTFGNITTTGTIEQTRVESGWDDIGETTNDSNWKVYTRIDDVLTLGFQIVGGVAQDGAGTPFVTQTVFSAAIATTAVTAVINEIQRYNPATTFTMDAPASPSVNDEFSTKNVTTSIVNITLDGNGNNIEGPTSNGAVAATVQVGGAGGESLKFKYDGTDWRLIS